MNLPSIQPTTVSEPTTSRRRCPAVILGLLGLVLFLSNPRSEEPPVDPRPLTEDVGTSRVENLGSRSALVIEGNQTFPTEQILKALTAHLDWYEVGHPAAPLAAYLEWLSSRIRSAYLRKGFPEASVDTQAEPDSGQVRISIAEGPRFYCGEIRLLGIEALTTDQVHRRITQHLSGFAQDQAPSTNTTFQLDRAVWTDDHPAPFDPQAIALIRQEIVTALADLNYWAVRLEVKVLPDADRGRGDLEITLLDEGMRGTLTDIEILGNRKDSTAEILDYLELKPGMEIHAELLSGITNKLYHSARFLRHNAALEALPEPGQFQLKLDLKEAKNAPPLTQSFTPAQQAWFNFYRWLQDWESRPEDIVFSITGELPKVQILLEAIVSSSGLVISAYASRPNEPRRLQYAALLSSEVSGVYSVWRGRKISGRPGGHVFGYLGLRANPDDEGPEGSFYMGAGTTSAAQFEGQPPFGIELHLDPVAAVLESPASKSATEEEHLRDGVLYYTHRDTHSPPMVVLMEIEAATGRLLAWRAEKQDPSKGAVRTELRLVEAAFAKALGEIADATANHPNDYSPDHPVSTLATYLLTDTLEFFDTLPSLCELMGCGSSDSDPPADPMEPAHPMARLAELQPQLHHLRAALEAASFQDLWNPLDRLLHRQQGEPDSEDPEEAFVIPLEESTLAPTPQGMMFVIAQFILPNVDDLWKPGSWPWTLTREATLTLAGKGKHTGAELQKLFESERAGPLAALSTATLLGKRNPALARRFAEQGLERLELDAVRRDWEALANDGHGLGQSLVALLDLTMLLGADLTALNPKTPPPLTAFLQAGRNRAEAQPAAPGIDTYWPLVEEYWEPAVKPWLAERFVPFLPQVERLSDPQALYERGVTVYSGQGVVQDFAEAAACFQKAADLGHGPSQLRYGMMLARGQGVTRNASRAAGVLLLAAEQGERHAQCELGRLYAAGIDGTPDLERAEACFRLETDQDCPAAQYFLAELLEKQGHYDESIDIFRRSASNGYPLAQYELAIRLTDGLSLSIDYAEAYFWLKLAQKQGHPLARALLLSTKSHLSLDQIDDLHRRVLDFEKELGSRSTQPQAIE